VVMKGLTFVLSHRMAGSTVDVHEMTKVKSRKNAAYRLTRRASILLN
jgi:hypothetical protein